MKKKIASETALRMLTSFFCNNFFLVERERNVSIVNKNEFKKQTQTTHEEKNYIEKLKM